MATRDLPDIYAQALGQQARGCGHIYQANPEHDGHGTSTKYYPCMFTLLIGEGRQTTLLL